MSKLSFRARALDASKPLPVFRCEDLPDLHEYASINRAVPQMPTGMEKEEESVCFVKCWPSAGGSVLAVFSHAVAPLCCLRKLVQNGHHICSFVHTTDLGEFWILRPRTITRVIIRVLGLDIVFVSRVVSTRFPWICTRKHKEVTWLVAVPPFCWLSRR